MGDLVISTPFLRAAAEKAHDVTLLLGQDPTQKVRDLQAGLWPQIKILPFVAPWTAFTGKYQIHRWPWQEMFRLTRQIREARFDLGVSARWDPRDHLLLALARVKKRFGFPRVGSRMFLTNPLLLPDPMAHRYDNYRTLGQALGLDLPTREKVSTPLVREGKVFDVLIHTGAAQRVRVWPLENYRKLAERLRLKQYRVQVACDPDQRDWWLRNGESTVATPQTVTELLAAVKQSCTLIGNDSGPGHLAAFAGVPTFTIFGPQVPEWFAPLHPEARWVEGKACPYKPCSDYCRFAEPLCLTGWTEPEIWTRIEPFVQKISSNV